MPHTDPAKALIVRSAMFMCIEKNRNNRERVYRWIQSQFTCFNFIWAKTFIKEGPHIRSYGIKTIPSSD